MRRPLSVVACLPAAAWIAAVPALMAVAWAGGAAAAATVSDVLREQGLEEYEKGHYAAAVTRFREAAGLGDRRCAEMLAVMLRQGEHLYGDQVRADPAEAAQWAGVAGRRPAAVAAGSTAAAR